MARKLLRDVTIDEHRPGLAAGDAPELLRFPRVRDLLFIGGDAEDALPIETAFGRARLSDAVGHFGLHRRDAAGVHHLARDPLGVNKLFYAIEGDEVVSSSFLVDLVRRGHALDRVFSVPSGHCVRVDPARRVLSTEKVARLRFGGDGPAALDVAALEAHAEAIRGRLEETFRMLARALEGRRVHVTLSGGLDSTTIAVLARAHLRDVSAVTFTLGDADDAHGDCAFARRVAEDLGMPLVVVRAERDALLELLDDVLLYGQDARDFNVHCGLVNAAIGRRLGEAHGTSQAPPVLLTGDTMNELLADYSPVVHRGRTFYALPRLSPGRLRRFLVQGLDSGDREVGIFARFGLETIQPYALCADAYAALPGALVGHGESKQRLVRAAFGARIPAYVYDRPKVRAQVASSAEVGGTLSALVDRGIDAAYLRARFAALLGARVEEVDALIRAGFYRFAVEYPEPRAPGARVR
jgi:asparagine synthetase B (glutamine-hydrolysing)